MPVCMAEECEGTVRNTVCIHVHTDKPYLELSNFSVPHTVCIIYKLQLALYTHTIHTCNCWSTCMC